MSVVWLAPACQLLVWLISAVQLTFTMQLIVHAFKVVQTTTMLTQQLKHVLNATQVVNCAMDLDTLHALDVR